MSAKPEVTHSIPLEHTLRIESSVKLVNFEMLPIISAAVFQIDILLFGFKFWTKKTPPFFSYLLKLCESLRIQPLLQILTVGI